MNDVIFKICSIEEFKNISNKEHTNLTVTLTKLPEIIKEEEQKLQLLDFYHNDPLYGGHCGQKRLYAKLKAIFHWKNMSKDVALFVRNCKKCVLNKPRERNKEQMTLTQTPQAPFDVVVIDTVGPFNTSKRGNNYCITMICNLTIFHQFVLKFGPMKQILTDRGTEY